MKTSSRKTLPAAVSARRPHPSTPPVLPRIRSILVPLDFSDTSHRSLKHAWALAESHEAKLVLIHSVEPVMAPDLMGGVTWALEDDALIENARRRMHQTVKELGIPPARLGKILVPYGRAFQEITEAARKLKIDLIVIATHGHTGWKHALLGSTAERVVRHADCPVLVLR